MGCPAFRVIPARSLNNKGIWLFNTVTLLILVVACFFVWGMARASDVTTEQVMVQVRVAMRQPDQMSFNQDIEARGIFGNYRWTAAVTRNGSNIQVHAPKAPSLVPKELLADLSDFEKALAGFRLEYKGEVVEEGVGYLLLEGVRKPGVTSGAHEGRLLVDPKTYLVRRIDAHYSWGKLRVDQTYTTYKGYTLLKEQRATMPLGAMRFVIAYRDYKFN